MDARVRVRVTGVRVRVTSLRTPSSYTFSSIHGGGDDGAHEEKEKLNNNT